MKLPILLLVLAVTLLLSSYVKAPFETAPNPWALLRTSPQDAYVFRAVQRDGVYITPPLPAVPPAGAQVLVIPVGGSHAGTTVHWENTSGAVYAPQDNDTVEASTFFITEVAQNGSPVGGNTACHVLSTAKYFDKNTQIAAGQRGRERIYVSEFSSSTPGIWIADGNPISLRISPIPSSGTTYPLTVHDDGIYNLDVIVSW
jgi:hypothetical protein